MEEHSEGAPLGEAGGEEGQAGPQQPSAGDAGGTQESAPPAPPAGEWYYSVGGTSYGPVDEERLKALARGGHFQRDDYVYSSYIGDWVRADSVYGLFEDAAATIGAAEAGIAAPPEGVPAGLPRAQYAGFWIRVGAVLIDGLVISIPNCLIVFTFVIAVLMPAIHQLEAAEAGGAATVVPAVMVFAVCGVLWVLLLAIGWLYFALMESSRWQATLGKRAVGVIVTDSRGARITFARATGRYFASMLSGMFLNIGYIMGAFTERRQTLHDMIADTIVVYGRSE